MKKVLKIFLISLVVFITAVLCFLFLVKMKPAAKISWGMDFSQKYAQQLGLDWKETYSALIDDMGVKNLKVAVDWDILEGDRGKFNFTDLDWQITKAGESGASVIPIIGMKTSRWPECHVPLWAKNLSKEKQQEEIVKMIEAIVLRYKNNQTVKYWQVENEAFFPFGECPWVDSNFLKKEVAIVRELDSLGRPVIISDSGEGSFWFSASKIGDIVGTTMYKKVWFTTPFFLSKYFGREIKTGLYVYYPFPPAFYGRKAEIIDKIFHKKVICIELQAEPWTNSFVTSTPQKEQEKTMDLEKFKKNIEFAKETGLSEFYLWGGEWMYWMKTKQNSQAIWDEAKKLFQ
jgi:hypothetical protein